MALEVFWGSGSTPAWRVLLALAVKGVPYESKLLSFSARDHKTPEFLQVNPRGQVPAIRDGAFTLWESYAILVYLDRKHPTPPLFGATAEDAGVIQRLVSEHDSHFFPATQEMGRPILFGGPTGTEGKEATIKEAAGRVHHELGLLNERLATRAYLTGAQISAADVVIFPTIKWIERIATRPTAAPLDLALMPVAARYPHVAAWCARIEALPGYDATFPPHWRNT
jgi:glutathione S-transferase